MKISKLLLVVSFSTLLLFTSQCKKKDLPQLPPETETGAMTFGCKVNGEVILPQDGNGKPGLYLQYTNYGIGVGGGWFLNINAYDYKKRKGITYRNR